MYEFGLKKMLRNRIKSFNRKYRFICIFAIVLTLANINSINAIPRVSFPVIINSPKEVIDQVWQIIYRDYLDSVGNYDQLKWKKIRTNLLEKNYSNDISSYEAIRGMLSSLEDPYTRFLDPKEFKEMRIDTSGELTGVGIQLSFDDETQQLIVVSPIEGTPAFKAGIKAKDVIISIDEKSTKDLTIENAVKLIRGKKGTQVVLGIKRKGDILIIPIVRSKIEILAVNSRINKTSSGIDIGYIRLKQFNANAAKEMKLSLNKLENSNVRGYVLDLRGNPGGLLESSIQIARQWLDEGIIVSTLTKDGIKDVRRANGRAITSKPVVVLVNEGSASASEILSGAIQDNKRGILVGQKTFGKGLVQSVRALSDGSGLTVTIAKYLTPNGTDIHKNGIIPDILSELSNPDSKLLGLSDIGTSKDSQYSKAENTLLELINTNKDFKSYKPTSANLDNALAVFP